MNRRTFLQTVGTTATLLLASRSKLLGDPSAPAKKKLNLLIITADDINGDSMGWMGSTAGATPNIDAFAATCYRFEQCFATAPICQPSREGLMTGRVPHRNGGLGFDPINPEVPCLPEIMSAAGYFTGAANKTTHMQPKEKFKWDMKFEKNSGRDPKPLRGEFEAMMKEADKQGKPFFLNINILDPHRPYYGQGKKKQLSPDAYPPSTPSRIFTEKEITVPSVLEDIPPIREEVAQYFTNVKRFDESFGEILNALKESGHNDNTIVVFLSDHGMSFPFSKATLYRNGAWTPMLMRWPELGKPSVNKNDMISNVDLMPTVLELLGIQAPSGMDGRSLCPILKGEKPSDRDHVFTHVNTVHSGADFSGRCIRTMKRSYIWQAWPDGKKELSMDAMGGTTWKAMAAAGKENAKIQARANQYLYGVPQQFFDLEKDPDERVNLMDDPQYKSEIEEMKKQLLVHMKTTNDPLLSQFEKTSNSK